MNTAISLPGYGGKAPCLLPPSRLCVHMGRPWGKLFLLIIAVRPNVISPSDLGHRPRLISLAGVAMVSATVFQVIPFLLYPASQSAFLGHWHYRRPQFHCLLTINSSITRFGQPLKSRDLKVCSLPSCLSVDHIRASTQSLLRDDRQQ